VGNVAFCAGGFVDNLDSIVRRYCISAGAKQDVGGGGFGAAGLIGVDIGLLCCR
jgi:hypothetical protein